MEKPTKLIIAGISVVILSLTSLLLTSFFIKEYFSNSNKKTTKKDIGLEQVEVIPQYKKLKILSSGNILGAEDTAGIDNSEIIQGDKLRFNLPVEFGRDTVFNRGLNIAGGGITVKEGAKIVGDLKVEGKIEAKEGIDNLQVKNITGSTLAGLEITDGKVIISKGDIKGVNNINIAGIIELGKNTISEGKITGNWDYSGGNITGVNNLTAGGTITFTSLTANRLVTTTTGGQLTTSITSANLAASVTDETGSGKLVFNDSPTFTTQITSPIVYGANTASGTLTLESTSNTTKGNILLNPNGGKVGIGTTSPGAKLEVKNGNILTSDNSWIGAYARAYSHGASGNVGFGANLYKDSDGQWKYVSVAGWGGYGAAWNFYASDRVELLLASNGANPAAPNAIFTIKTQSGRVGIGTTSPLDKLTIKDSVPSLTLLNTYTDNNLRIKNDAGAGYHYFQTVNDDGSVANTFMAVRTSNGNVGIGTVNPDNLLELNKDVTGYVDLLKIADDTDPGAGSVGLLVSTLVSEGHIRAYGSGETGFLASSFGVYAKNGNLDLFTTGTTNNIYFMTAGNYTNPRMTIRYDGNVGIGTTSPGAKLHVDYGASGTALKLTRTGTQNVGDTLDILWGSTTTGKDYTKIGSVIEGAGDVGLAFYTTTNDGVTIAERVRIDNTGNVGIGTTSPSYKLHVQGTGYFSDNLKLAPTKRLLGGGYSSYSFLGLEEDSVSGLPESTNNIVLSSVANTVISIDTNNNTSTAAFIVGTNDIYPGKTNWSELFRVQENGNVGIGTTSPQTKLHISGSATVSDPSPVLFTPTSGEGGVAFHMVQSGTKEYSGFGFGVYWDGSIWNALSDTVARVLKNPNIGLTFLTQNGLTPGNAVSESNVRMVIDYNGNVGIGTTGPGYKLQVGTAGDGTSAIANAWNTFSDIRFKENIRSIDGALDKVLRLEGVYFDWKKTGEHSMGLIAQQVREVIPEVVSEDDRGYLSVDYSRLTPVLIEAVKEQEKKIKENELRIDEFGNIIYSTSSGQLSSAPASLANSASPASPGNKVSVIDLLKERIKALADKLSELSSRLDSLFAELTKVKRSEASGSMVIPKGTKDVKIKFPAEFEEKPIVFVSSSQSSLPGYRITEVTPSYFVVSFESALKEDLEISWLARVSLDSKQAQLEVINSENGSNSQPEPTTSPQPSLTPTPEVNQTDSPTPISTPSSTPTLTPTTVPSSPTPTLTPAIESSITLTLTPSPTPTVSDLLSPTPTP